MDAEHPGGDLSQVVAVGKALAVEGLVEGIDHLLGDLGPVYGAAVDSGHRRHILGPLHPALQLQRGHTHLLDGGGVVDQAVVLETQGILIFPPGVAVALAAGLGAAPPVAGPAADHGGEIALAGIAHAQGSVAEDLDLDGRMGADIADLLPVQLPAQDHPLDAHGGAHLDTCQIVDRHLGGAVDRHMGGDLAAQLHHPPVLDDEGIHPGGGRRPDQVAQLLHLLVRNQGIEGQMHLHPPDMAIF